MSKTTTIQKRYRPKELAAYWGCTEGHLSNLRSQGRGPAWLRLGGSVVYAAEDVEAFEAARRVTTLDQAA